MHLFISAGSWSGDLHACKPRPCPPRTNPRPHGRGVRRPACMAAAGVDLHYPLTDLAVMWFSRVVAHLPTFFRIARRAEVYFRTARPDAVVVIDYPGFHWAVASAQIAGIPCFISSPRNSGRGPGGVSARCVAGSIPC